MQYVHVKLQLASANYIDRTNASQVCTELSVHALCFVPPPMLPSMLLLLLSLCLPRRLESEGAVPQ